MTTTAWLLIDSNVRNESAFLRWNWKNESDIGSCLLLPGNYSSANAERKLVQQEKERYAVYEITKSRSRGDIPSSKFSFLGPNLNSGPQIIVNTFHNDGNSVCPTKTITTSAWGSQPTTALVGLFDCRREQQSTEVTAILGSQEHTRKGFVLKKEGHELHRIEQQQTMTRSNPMEVVI
jgi:hypothetical protein